MDGRDLNPLPAFGLRLGLWYATLFVVGALVIVLLTYWVTAASLEQRDRQIIRSKLGEYSVAYQRGGLRALTDTVQAEQAVAPERLFVRVVARGAETIILSQPQGWEPSSLETDAVQLSDGTLVQVGKSTESRDDLLSRFRIGLAMVTLSIVLIALTGGAVATRSAVLPIRRLSDAVKRIIATGRTDERVPSAVESNANNVDARLAQHGNPDAIDELTVSFNTMLDRIERLVKGMRGALDNVSHDLRTPLTRLRGAAELALAGPADVDRYREALADCVEETDRVLVMLNTLMDISEAESGVLRLKREAVSLGEIVERAVDLYRDVAEAKGVTITVEASKELSVEGDATRLQQVVANLLDNAVKYTPGGGSIRVRTGRQRDRALLEVADEGIGIPTQDLPRIWDRLFRGDASRTERGLGLGLSLVRAIVEAHGGAVSVTSEPGKGSTFVVTLPNLTPM
jgi:signal transduction histidine kinase